LLGGKCLELLLEIAPGLKRAAIFNPDTAPISSFISSLEAAARALRVVPVIALGLVVPLSIRLRADEVIE
jgi:hypothetical protein